MSLGHILIIDDNESFRLLVAHHLRKQGYTVDEAPDGLAGLDLFSGQSFDAVLVDLRMPGLDGQDVIARLAGKDDDIPCIVISGEGGMEDAITVMRQGASDYVVKGETVLSEVDQALRKALERAAYHRSQQERVKSAEIGLAQSEQRFQTLLELSPLPVVVTDINTGRCMYANKIGADRFGISQEEVEGLLSNSFYADKRARAVLRQELLACGKISDVEIELVRRDGTTFWTKASAVLMELDGRQAAYISFSDITENKNLEKALRRFQFIANASHDLMTLSDSDYVFKAANSAYLGRHRKNESEVVGRTMAEIWGEEVFENNIRPYFDKCLEGETLSYKAWFNFPASDRKYYEVTMYPYFSTDDKVTHIATVSRDITEAAEAQAAILESREHFRAIFESSIDPIFLFDTSLRVADMNTAAIARFGFSKHELVGRTLRRLHISAPSFAAFNSNVKPALIGAGSWIGEWKFCDNDGTVVPTETSFSVISSGEDSQWSGYVAVMRDISQRLKAMRARARTEERYRVMFESMGAATIIIEEDGRISNANQRFVELSGYARGEIVDKLMWRIFVGDQVARHQSGSWESRFKTRHDSLRHVFLHVGALPDSRQRVVSIVDISDRKQIEDKLQEAIEEMDAIQQNTIIGIGLFHGDSVTRINERGAEIFGSTPEELVGTNLSTYFPGSDGTSSFIRSAMRSLKSEGYHETDQRLHRRDGTTVWVSLFAKAIDKDDLGQGVIWTILDITERRYNEVVATMLYRISNAVSTTSDMGELYVRIHRILDDNINAKNFFVGLLDDARQQLEFTYFEDAMDDFKGRVFRLDDTDLVSLSVEVIRLGRPLIVTQQPVAGEESLGGDAAASRFKYVSRSDFLKEKGVTEAATVGHMSQVWLGVPLRVKGEVVGVMAVQSYSNPYQYTDRDVELLVSVSEQVALALERKGIEVDLLAAKELAEAANRSKSEFLANMSHEVRTPLNGVLGMLQLAQTTELDEEQQDYVATALSSGRSLLSIINDILDFSKIEAGKMEVITEPFSPKLLVDEVLSAFRAEAQAKGLTLDIRVDAAVPEVIIGGKSRLKQILFNLVGNGLKFTREGSVVVSVRVDPKLSTSEQVRLLISVTDTGIGIPESKIGTIFEPFTQVDGSYVRQHQGTGLGLGIVKRLVELMGGELDIASKEGHGTRIVLSFDFRVDVERSGDSNRCIGCTGYREGLSLLVVEDNRVNRIMAQRMLVKLGHRAAMASDGREALELLARESFDGVFMDIQMPGMDGVETTRQIRNASPDSGINRHVRVVAMTAHAMVGDREVFLSGGMDDYVSKPVEMQDMKEVLNRLFPQQRDVGENDSQ